MRFFLAAFTLLLVCFPLRADVIDFNVNYFKVGVTTRFESGNTLVDTRIVEIIDKDTMLMRAGTALRGFSFLVKGEPTKGLVDDKLHRLDGAWEIADTQKYAGKTYYVFKRAKEAPKPPSKADVKTEKSLASGRRPGSSTAPPLPAARPTRPRPVKVAPPERLPRPEVERLAPAKSYSPFDAWRSAGKLVDDRIRVEGLATVRPGRDCLVIDFRVKGRRTVCATVPLAQAGPLAGLKKGEEIDLVLEGDVQTGREEVLRLHRGEVIKASGY